MEGAGGRQEVARVEARDEIPLLRGGEVRPLHECEEPIVVQERRALLDASQRMVLIRRVTAAMRPLISMGSWKCSIPEVVHEVVAEDRRRVTFAAAPTGSIDRHAET